MCCMRRKIVSDIIISFLIKVNDQHIKDLSYIIDISSTSQGFYFEKINLKNKTNTIFFLIKTEYQFFIKNSCWEKYLRIKNWRKKRLLKISKVWNSEKGVRTESCAFLTFIFFLIL